VLALETRVNQRVAENLPVVIAFEDASEAQGLRRASERGGELRIVSIEGLDRSPCGGTHVRATGEIGPVLIRKLDKIRGNVRLEFLCGTRAVRRARADFDALSRIAKMLSAPLDDSPSLVAALREAGEAAEKARQRLAAELARFRGREMYEAALAGPDGLRRGVHRQPSGSLEEVRGLAQGFTAQPKAVFVGAVEDPPAVLLAVSADTGLNAGKLLKTALEKFGGRGGGSAVMAQGSVASPQGLAALLRELP
jgi:alanyl-tRNA synthetase